MFGPSFESVLSECLDAMRLGATVDDCLARYPKLAKRLRTQLSLAAQISKTPLVAARPEARAIAWQAVQRRANELRSGTARPRAFRPAATGLGWLKPVAIAAVVVASLSASGGGLLYAAQDATPDSSLYAVKLAGEDVRVWFIFDDTHKANVLLDQSAQRMEEINQAVRHGKPVPENALSDMNSRNQKAAEILAGQIENSILRGRVNSQAEEQEQRLLALWPQVKSDDRVTYARVVANLHNIQLGGGIAVADIELRPEALTGGIFTISGLAETVQGDIWRIGGFEVRIDRRTLGQDNVKAGSGASILAAKSSNGQLQALTADLQDISLPPTTTFVSGEVEKVSDKGVTVAGQFIPFSDETIQLGSLKIGQQVQISIQRNQNGLSATGVNQFAGLDSAEGETFWFIGTIESNSTSEWSVSGLVFEIAPSTTVDATAGAAAAGARVHIEGVNKDGALLARRATVLTGQADASSVFILGTFNGYDSADEAWKISGLSVTPPVNANAEDDPAGGSLVLVQANREGASMVAVNIEIVEGPQESGLFRLDGSIEAIDGSRWTLGYGEVRVGSTAHVLGSPEVGKRVIVWATQRQDSLDATFVQVLDQSPVVTPAPVAPEASPTATP